MFDEMPDQFYQFLAAARGSTATATAAAASATLPLPLSFSLHHHHHHHHASFPSYPPPPPPPQTSFDSPPFPLSPPPPTPPHHHLLHHSQLPLQLLQQAASHIKHEDKEETTTMDDPWSHDEVLALLRIRSSMDNNWFPADFTWENVSRKLAEIGFKRSAEKCKEKFEEETGSFNTSIITNCNSKNIINNYRLFGELEELCNNNNADHHHHQSPPPPPNPDLDQGYNHNHDDHETLLSQMIEIQKPTENEGHEQVEEQEQEQDKIIIGKDQILGDDDKKVREQSVDDSEKTEENTKGVAMRKRKRQNKFEMFKGFCESIVNNMMAQQEQLHCKILHDMVKRDEEKIAKEEAWKKQEIERIRNEMEVRAHELAIAGDRQSKILDMLKKFMSSNSFDVGDAIENLIKVSNTSSNSFSQDSLISAQPTSSCTTHDQNPSSLMIPNMPTSSSNENLASQSPNRVENSKLALPISSSQNPNPINTIENDAFSLTSVPTHKSSGSDHISTDAADHITPEKQPKDKPHVGSTVKDDTGRRWPRDEVLALINIRCGLFNNNNGDHHPHHDSRESSAKGPLWERISQKMMELGYRRSAKRCKEKWENINKYFRKTKDLNKKRSIDSRTCPYFHQLSHLYSHGAVVGTTDPPTDHPPSPENTPLQLPGVQGGSCTRTNSNGATTTMHACLGNEGVVQVPAFEFEF